MLLFLISLGRFVSEKFEEIFAKHALTQQQALTADELQKFMKSNREPKDYGGWYIFSNLFSFFKQWSNVQYNNGFVCTGWLVTQSGRYCITFARTNTGCCTKTQ